MGFGTEDYYSSDVQITTLISRMESNILEITRVVSALSVGSGLFTKLDILDGTMDGVITLSDLNSEQCNMLGELVGIDTSVTTGGNLIDKLDALDGTMDGRLTVAQLNASDVKDELTAIVQNLDGTIGTLKASIDELVGVHTDTTAMVNFAEQDWGGSYGSDTWTLVSDINVRRNLLEVTVSQAAYYSRDNGATTAGTIQASGTGVFHDSAGVWLQKTSAGSGNFEAHEEWAT